MPLLLLAAACVCTRDPDKSSGGLPDTDPMVLEAAKSFMLDADAARKDLEVFTQQPHPFGSPRNTAVADHVITRVAGMLSSKQVKISKQAFTATVPNPAAQNASGPVSHTLERTGANIVATGALKPDASCIILFGSHYDTKELEGATYVGANDSGSSSVALIQMLAHLANSRGSITSECDIGAVWFDGEEAVLLNWTDGQRNHPAKIQDNTYGSRHFVAQLAKCDQAGQHLWCMPQEFGGKAVVALVLLDMIGSPNIKITRDLNSSSSLIKTLEAGTKALGVPGVLSSSPTAIEDDHIPFRRAGIAAIDIIDFHNTDVWHVPGDDLDKISYESIELASRLGIYTALAAAAQPKVFAETTE